MPDVDVHEVAAGLLRAGDRFLLCHRRPDRRWYPDVWDFPGGHVAESEPPADALVREIREELGVVIERPTGDPAEELHAEGLHVQIWVIDRWTGEVHNTAPEEHDGLRWVGLDDLGEMRLADPSYPHLLARLAAG